MWFWPIFFGLIFVCILSAIIYSNHNMKLKWEEATNTDVRLVREAAEHSVRASNTLNPIIALSESVAAHRTLEMLIRRYGVQRANEICGLDAGDLMKTMSLQRDHILQDITTTYPDMLPKGDLKGYAGYVKERNESREHGVAHIEEEEEHLGRI
jgi:hypothetical protein